MRPRPQGHRPAIARTIDVLPPPDGEDTIRCSPGRTAKSTWETRGWPLASVMVTSTSRSVAAALSARVRREVPASASAKRWSIASAASVISTMRRAEAYALLAQAALGAGDHAAALSAWKQAWPEYQRAFPEGHVERELVWAIGKQAEEGTGTPRP